MSLSKYVSQASTQASPQLISRRRCWYQNIATDCFCGAERKHMRPVKMTPQHTRGVEAGLEAIKRCY